MQAFLYFENDLFIKAKSFGSPGTKVGEIVFNTSLSGYQEIITDPSYAGQFVLFTMPEIGIVGANEQDCESDFACEGILISQYNDNFSNFRAQNSLSHFLKKRGIFGICGLNTRFLTKMVRDFGTMHVVISTEISSKDELKNILHKQKGLKTLDLINKTSTKESKPHNQGIFDFSQMGYLKNQNQNESIKIIAIDCGIKQNILNELYSAGFEIELLPFDFDPKELLSRYENGDFKGLFLSNGPGDPLDLDILIEKIKFLLPYKIPTFGICLGHQILSIAHGFNTHKLKFGHHGGNHPVKNLLTGEVEITAQNHNFAVPEDIATVANITHRDLFDNTIEGVEYKNAPFFSVQYHPESSPGPKEASFIFQKFADLINQIKQTKS
ncbi:MAG: glutamine-hydrolyzing carbamoyl-phosphate synthase small subunit [Helicobacter sp.]|nr:glutamine-hydrolyzing carbamoyl-phosphate synthase small subunit [Helicobacter sp.]